MKIQNFILKSLFAAGLFLLVLGSLSSAQLVECDDFSKYIMNKTTAVMDNYKTIYAAWDANQGQQGWNKYRLGMIGNSITNAHPYMGSMKQGIRYPACSFRTYDNYARTLCGMNFGDLCWLVTDKGGSSGNASGMRATWGCSPGVENALTNLKPMWSIIMFGTNDVKGGSFGLNTTADAGMRCIVDKLLAENVMPVLSSIPPIVDQDGSLVNQVRDSIKAIAEEYNIIWLDLLQAFEDYGPPDGKSLMSDNLHPNVAPSGCGDGLFDTGCLETGGYNVRTKLSFDVLIMLDKEVVLAAANDVRGSVAGATAGDLSVMIKPNPVSISVNLSLEMRTAKSELRNFKIGIYDIAGNLISDLDQRGSHSAFRSSGYTWYTQDCPSGIYIVSVQSGDIKTQKYFTLVR
jgi:hypothetical protein